MSVSIVIVVVEKKVPLIVVVAIESDAMELVGVVMITDNVTNVVVVE
jgi:hypothetical protein